MKELLLPNYFKKIGLIAGSLLFIAFVIIFALGELGSTEINLDLLGQIVKDLILVCLFFIAFGKETRETEAIKKLRYDKLMKALLFGGLILLFDSISNLVFDRNHEVLKSGYEIMVVVLLFYIATFNFNSKT
ncbi:hypothetical protein E0K83_02910 [Gramella sp. BOM4]|nr:hypothetical protein [Christiangramia bathymodioli]